MQCSITFNRDSDPDPGLGLRSVNNNSTEEGRINVVFPIFKNFHRNSDPTIRLEKDSNPTKKYFLQKLFKKFLFARIKDMI